MLLVHQTPRLIASTHPRVPPLATNLSNTFGGTDVTLLVSARQLSTGVPEIFKERFIPILQLAIASGDNAELTDFFRELLGVQQMPIISNHPRNDSQLVALIAKGCHLTMLEKAAFMIVGKVSLRKDQGYEQYRIPENNAYQEMASMSRYLPCGTILTEAVRPEAAARYILYLINETLAYPMTPAHLPTRFWDLPVWYRQLIQQSPLTRPYLWCAYPHLTYPDDRIPESSPKIRQASVPKNSYQKAYVNPLMATARFLHHLMDDLTSSSYTRKPMTKDWQNPKLLKTRLAAYKKYEGDLAFLIDQLTIPQLENLYQAWAIELENPTLDYAQYQPSDGRRYNTRRRSPRRYPGIPAPLPVDTPLNRHSMEETPNKKARLNGAEDPSEDSKGEEELGKHMLNIVPPDVSARRYLHRFLDSLDVPEEEDNDCKSDDIVFKRFKQCPNWGLEGARKDLFNIHYVGKLLQEMEDKTGPFAVPLPQPEAKIKTMTNGQTCGNKPSGKEVTVAAAEEGTTSLEAVSIRTPASSDNNSLETANGERPPLVLNEPPDIITGTLQLMVQGAELPLDMPLDIRLVTGDENYSRKLSRTEILAAVIEYLVTQKALSRYQYWLLKKYCDWSPGMSFYSSRLDEIGNLPLVNEDMPPDSFYNLGEGFNFPYLLRVRYYAEFTDSEGKKSYQMTPLTIPAELYTIGRLLENAELREPPNRFEKQGNFLRSALLNLEIAESYTRTDFIPVLSTELRAMLKNFLRGSPLKLLTCNPESPKYGRNMITAERRESSSLSLRSSHLSCQFRTIA